MCTWAKKVFWCHPSKLEAQIDFILVSFYCSSVYDLFWRAQALSCDLVCKRNEWLLWPVFPTSHFLKTRYCWFIGASLVGWVVTRKKGESFEGMILSLESATSTIMPNGTRLSIVFGTMMPSCTPAVPRLPPLGKKYFGAILKVLQVLYEQFGQSEKYFGAALQV